MNCRTMYNTSNNNNVIQIVRLLSITSTKVTSKHLRCDITYARAVNGYH